MLCYTYTSHGNHPFHIELCQLPLTSSLQHLQEIQQGHTVTSSQGPSSKEPGGIHIGAGLPRVPFKLAEKIQSEEYVDMLELLPDLLGVSGNTKPQGPKKKVISSILKWVQCFSIYFSVIALKEPQRAPDLLSYMNLIIKAHL